MLNYSYLKRLANFNPYLAQFVYGSRVMLSILKKKNNLVNLGLKSYTFFLFFIPYLHVWIWIHKAPEYGSGSTTLFESEENVIFFMCDNFLLHLNIVQARRGRGDSCHNGSEPAQGL